MTSKDPLFRAIRPPAQTCWSSYRPADRLPSDVDSEVVSEGLGTCVRGISGMALDEVTHERPRQAGRTSRGDSRDTIAPAVLGVT